MKIVPDWYQQAQRLAEHWQTESLHPATTHVLNQFAVSWGVACSGGADSLALLLLLWARYPKRRSQLRVLHFNHGVRGEAAAADAEFVREVAQALGLAFHAGQAAPPAPDANVGENELRNARLNFFAESGCSFICLGQHANDIAETLLMRICRGSGTEGLAAPRPVSQPTSKSPVHIRPMLNWPRALIEEGLRTIGIEWREDATNHSTNFFRNRVRHQVWPVLSAASPGTALAGTTRTRQLLEEDAEALDLWLETVFPADTQEDTLSSLTLRGKPRALWRRALLRWLARQDLLQNLSANGLDDLLDNWIELAPLRFSIGHARFLVADDRGVIKLIVDHRAPSWTPHTLTLDSALALPARRWLQLRTAKLNPTLRTAIRAGNFPETESVYLGGAVAEAMQLQVRLWQPGDRYRPLGCPGSRKLQDCFTDRKIPERERKRLPVVCDGGGDILWVPGLPPSESCRVGSECKSALWLTYRAF
nr:tRNA lysidine(34) synthetase TilS [Cerasicoccus arenae]